MNGVNNYTLTNVQSNNKLFSWETLYHALLPLMAIIYFGSITKALIEVTYIDIALISLFPWLLRFSLRFIFKPNFSNIYKVILIVLSSIIIILDFSLIIKEYLETDSAFNCIYNWIISQFNITASKVNNAANIVFVYFVMFWYLVWFIIFFVTNNNYNFIITILKLKREQKADFFENLKNLEKNDIISRVVNKMLMVQQNHNNITNTNKVKLKHVTQKVINETDYSIKELADYYLPKGDLPKTLHESFIYSLKTLNNIYDCEKSFAWYVAINDMQVLMAEWKTDYLIKFLNFSISKIHVDIRRIYVVDRTNYNNNFSSLFEVVLLSYLCGVNAKILVFENIGDDNKIIYKTLGHLLLLDYGIVLDYNENYYSISRPVKRIMCSDISFDSRTDLHQNKLYVLDDCYTFNSFKEHFLSLWEHKNFKLKKNINCISEDFDIAGLIDHTLFRIQNHSIDWSSIASSIKLFDKRPLSDIEQRLQAINNAFIDDNNSTAESFINQLNANNFIFKTIKQTSNEY